MADVQHRDIPDSELHEPKGVAGANVNTVYVADGAGSGSWSPYVKGTIIGYADYNDSATATTPINLVANTPVYLTNDALGSNTKDRLQTGIGADSLWDSTENKFDWFAAGLQLDDMVDIRLDIQVTTTAANQSYEVFLEMATDSGSSYPIPFASGTVKTAGAKDVNRYNGVYMGDNITLNNKARFRIVSDAAATVVVRGWYVKVITNR